MNLKGIRMLMAGCMALLCLQGTLLEAKTFALELNSINAMVEDDDPEKFKHSANYHLSESSQDATEPAIDTTTSENESDTVTDETEPTTEPGVSPNTLTHNVRFEEDYVIIDGIDVSKYQPVVDWESIAADGIEFAIIRIGYRGYGAAGNMKVDPYFEDHINGAIAAGIDVGVYFFTQAITEEEAVEEANFVLEHLEGYELDAPVYIDIENITYDVGRLDTANLTAEQHTANCIAFCETIEAAGYEAGIYANKYWLREELVAESLEDRYTIWLANYTDETDYEGNYQCWQFTDKGRVDGIDGNVDRNVYYSRKLEYKNDSYIFYEAEPATPILYGDGDISFSSSDTSIAVVDETGCITPVSNGTVTVTAVSDNGTSDEIEITVAAFSELLLKYSSLQLDALGNTEILVSADSKTAYTWLTSDSNVITVSADGTIKAVGYGSAWVIAIDAAGNVGICNVTVTCGDLIVGDCNGDGAVNALDAAAVLVHSAISGTSVVEVTEDVLYTHDVNKDRTINSLDAASILVMSAAAGTRK